MVFTLFIILFPLVLGAENLMVDLQGAQNLMVDSQDAQNLMVDSQSDKSAKTPVLSAKKFNGRFAGC